MPLLIVDTEAGTITELHNRIEGGDYGAYGEQIFMGADFSLGREYFVEIYPVEAGPDEQQASAGVPAFVFRQIVHLLRQAEGEPEGDTLPG